MTETNRESLIRASHELWEWHEKVKMGPCKPTTLVLKRSKKWRDADKRREEKARSDTNSD